MTDEKDSLRSSSSPTALARVPHMQQRGEKQSFQSRVLRESKATGYCVEYGAAEASRYGTTSSCTGPVGVRHTPRWRHITDRFAGCASHGCGQYQTLVCSLRKVGQNGMQWTPTRSEAIGAKSGKPVLQAFLQFADCTKVRVNDDADCN